MTTQKVKSKRSARQPGRPQPRHARTSGHYVSIKDGAAHYGVCRLTLYRWAKRPLLHAGARGVKFLRQGRTLRVWIPEGRPS